MPNRAGEVLFIWQNLIVTLSGAKTTFSHSLWIACTGLLLSHSRENLTDCWFADAIVCKLPEATGWCDQTQRIMNWIIDWCFSSSSSPPVESHSRKKKKKRWRAGPHVNELQTITNHKASEWKVGRHENLPALHSQTAPLAKSKST